MTSSTLSDDHGYCLPVPVCWLGGRVNALSYRSCRPCRSYRPSLPVNHVRLTDQDALHSSAPATGRERRKAPTFVSSICALPAPSS